MATEKRNYLYLYDLPKEITTSTKIAETFKEQGIDISSDKKPQIARDLFRPFYSAIVHIEDDAKYKEAVEKMKYPVMQREEQNGQSTQCQVRALKFDKDLRGENKAKVMNLNIFYKPPKGSDTLNYKFLHEYFEKYGPVRSTKISVNKDYSRRGMAFVCFENEEGLNKCLADPNNKDTCTKFKPRELKDAAIKMVNNLYFKNVPLSYTETAIKDLFAPFGKIKSCITQQNNEIQGQFGFVCYEDPNDKMHGPKAVNEACEKLMDKDMGMGPDGKPMKLYIRHFLSKKEREEEKLQETIRYKNSKKRCNLYVKNFPISWQQKDLENLFGTYGKIENIKLETGFQSNTFAFVCFEKPDACSQAKQALSGQTYDGKQLVINHYEIKEVRDLQLEEIKDKRDWENYTAKNTSGQPLSMLNNNGNLTQIIQQLLQIMQTQQPQSNYQNRQYPRPNNQHQGGRPNNMQNKGGQRQNYQMQQQPGPMGHPQQQMQQQPMVQQPNMMPQQQPPQQQQAMTPQQTYMVAAQKLLPAVQDRNPHLKEQVGHLIYDYVQMISGPQKAPKITGMLIELPNPQIKEYLSNFSNLQQRVEEANRLLENPDQGPQ